jgi:protein gp37
MADATKISWTDSTFNPWIGCTNVSPGCDACYAQALAERYGWAKWGKHDRKRTSLENWKKPLRWNADGLRFERVHGHRHRVFCASLADVFDNQVDPAWRHDLFALIHECRNLDWQLLTKRPQNITKMLPSDWGTGWPNVWLGATAEDEKRYRLRWPVLARIPAAIRFISYEPAIASIGTLAIIDTLPHWVICGGESGPRARDMNPNWVREVRDQCRAHGIAYFLKQFGTYRSNPIVFEHRLSPREAEMADPMSNGKGGALLDGKLHREFPSRQKGQQERGTNVMGNGSAGRATPVVLPIASKDVTVNRGKARAWPSKTMARSRSVG